MTVVTLTPDAIASTTGTWTRTGAATNLAAITDGSDSSYLTGNAGATLQATFGTTTIPSGGVVKRTELLVRGQMLTSSDNVEFRLIDPTGPIMIDYPVWGTALVTATGALLDAALAQSSIDGLEGRIALTTRQMRLMELSARVTVVPKPVATISTPSGTITATNQPAVTWTQTLDTDGGTRTAYQVQILNSTGTTVLQDSGVLTDTANTWTPAAASNASYRAQVRVAQTVNGALLWSDWSQATYTLNVTPPPVPVLTLTPQPSEGLVDIGLATGGATPSTEYFEVQRSIDGGTTWTTIRTKRTDGLITAADTAVGDWECPIGVVVQYRARAAKLYSGVLAWSGYDTESTTLPASAGWWLRHPTRPSLALKVELAGFPGVVRQARQSQQVVLGRQAPVTVADTRATATGSVRVTLYTDADRAALDALLGLCCPLLLHGPVADGWAPLQYVTVGDAARTRAADKAFIAATYEDLPITVVQRPTDVAEAWPA